MNDFEKACEFIKKHIPNFEVRYKNESITSKIIAMIVWIFNKRYLQDYTTTRYPRVYFPSKKFVEENPKTSFKILMHEFVHLWDRKSQGVWFNFNYLFPQILSLPNLILATVWLVVIKDPTIWQSIFAGLGFFFGIIFLLPIPSKSRAIYELRGYTMNIAVNYWEHRTIKLSTYNWILERFIGWDYYRMWPWRKQVFCWLIKASSQIKEERFEAELIGNYSALPYKYVKEFIKDND